MVVEIDVTSQRLVEEALDRVRCERGREIAAVIHLVAFFAFSGKPDPRYDAVNVRAGDPSALGRVRIGNDRPRGKRSLIYAKHIKAPARESIAISALNYMGALKWPSVALVTLVPVVAFLYW